MKVFPRPYVLWDCNVLLHLYGEMSEYLICDSLAAYFSTVSSMYTLRPFSHLVGSFKSTLFEFDLLLDCVLFICISWFHIALTEARQSVTGLYVLSDLKDLSRLREI